MAETRAAIRQWLAALWIAPLMALLMALAPPVAVAEGAAVPESAASAAQAAPPASAVLLMTEPASAPAAPPDPVASRRWAAVPLLRGRLTAAELGLVINADDPDSVALGRHYAAARGLAPEQLLRVRLPRRPVLTPEEFATLQSAIERHFGPRTQALALAWTQPYAVGCNSLTGALALGYDAALCEASCGRSRPSGWFNSASVRPLSVPGIRPSMLLAAPTLAEAKALVDRGVAADGSLVGKTGAAARVLLLDGPDRFRQVRRYLYPPGTGGPLPWAPGVEWQELPAETALPGAERLLVAITGSVQLPLTPPPKWLPGGLGDHLTSFGGELSGTRNQATVLEWIASGATASHGTVSEPCNHWQKFPHPQVLLGHYLQGATAIEAYWRSVAWPQQSLFVGEPLAAPFSPAANARRPRR